jgi:TolA-binding protein
MSRQQSGRYDESLADVKKYLSSEPKRSDRSDALYIRGLSQTGKDQNAEAIATFQSILDEDPEYAGTDKVLYELAWAKQSNGKADEAVSLFKRITEAFPQSALAAEAFYHVGEAAYDQKQYPEAAQAYDQARQQLGDNLALGEKINYKLGWSLYQQGQYDKAREAFAQQVELQPDGTLVGDGLFMQGECFFNTANYADALVAYGNAAAKPQSSDVIVVLTHLHAGQAAAQVEKWKESLDWLEKIAVKHPKSNLMPQVRYEMAVAQQNLGNPQVALQLFDGVADSGQGEMAARARFMMGELHYANKEYAKAIREFRLVMFGFDKNAGPKIRTWQAKAGFEAGQCAGVMASQQADRANRERFVDLAKKFFDYVRTRHSDSDEAAAAIEQLKKYEG